MIKNILLLTAIAFLPLTASAATLSDVELSTTPTNPAPGQSVSVKATLIGGEAATTAFQWIVNGTVVYEGVGSDQITLEAPSLGKQINVLVNIGRNGQSIGSGSLLIQPAAVTIVWEGNTSRPPFYTALPLLGGQGTATALAIPSLVQGGTVVPTQSIFFAWTIDGKKLTSGFGKNTIQVTPPFYTNTFRLGVTASANNGSLVAESSAVITPHTADAVIYEESPLGGLQDEKAITDTFSFNTDEVSFRAYPLTVPGTDILTSKWTLDGNAIAVDPADPYAAIFKKTAVGRGSYTVGFSYTNVQQFLERAQASFLLQF
jgi:hypothetical protein